MAKDVYKIPDSLNKSIGDNEIALKSKDGMGLKPRPLKILLCYAVSIFLGLFLAFNTFIKDANIVVIIIFLLLWTGLTALLFAVDKTGEPKYKMVFIILEYLPRAMRTLITRSFSNASPFYALVGIKKIHKRSGLIEFTDGTFGFSYRVVGTGSVLLFDADKRAILNRVDMFYRKMQHDCELIFITTKEAQKVYRQLESMDKRLANLKTDDEDLRKLLLVERDKLQYHVGGAFRSIHQYLILKADNKEALNVAKNILQSECENSMLMFKQCSALFGEDIENMLKVVYQGEESI